jgi:hypothetical protein
MPPEGLAHRPACCAARAHCADAFACLLCGADRDRTGYLLHAMEALSQVSYGPETSLIFRVLSSVRCVALTTCFSTTCSLRVAKRSSTKGCPMSRRPVEPREATIPTRSAKAPETLRPAEAGGEHRGALRDVLRSPATSSEQRAFVPRSNGKSALRASRVACHAAHERRDRGARHEAESIRPLPAGCAKKRGLDPEPCRSPNRASRRASLG